MSTIAQTTDSANPRTQEGLLMLGLAAYRDAVDQYRELTGPQRRIVLTATADLIANLRAGGVTK